MRYTKECEICGTSFKCHKSKGVKYCSGNCRVKAYQQRQGLRLSKVLPCLCCGTAFVSCGNHKKVRFCNEGCKIEYYKQAAKDKRAAKRQATIKICKLCKEPFTPSRRLTQEYCSKRCAQCIRKRAYSALRNCWLKAGSVKSGDTFSTLGYSADDLLRRLESFPQWERLKGKEWHLDHIFPIKAFVDHGITDVATICRLDNMQPLPIGDNHRKNRFYDPAAFEAWLVA